jgi:hypothetical protein
MTTFLAIYFFSTILIFAFLIYKFIITKPVKQKLIEAENKLKIQEEMNALLYKELPLSDDDKLKRFNELTTG